MYGCMCQDLRRDVRKQFKGVICLLLLGPEDGTWAIKLVASYLRLMSWFLGVVFKFHLQPNKMAQSSSRSTQHSTGVQTKRVRPFNPLQSCRPEPWGSPLPCWVIPCCALGYGWGLLHCLQLPQQCGWKQTFYMLQKATHKQRKKLSNAIYLRKNKLTGLASPLGPEALLVFVLRQVVTVSFFLLPPVTYWSFLND